MNEAGGNTTTPAAGAARCGIAALVGRPNVGKSTLLNALLGSKVSIVSPKPQTTRTRIHGVLTRPGLQIVFADLPGIHTKQPRAINRYMNRTALSSLADSDVNLFVIEALRWTDEDERALGELRQAGRPIVLIINKVDRAKPKERLLPFIDEIVRKADFAEVVPLSALKRNNIERLPDVIARYLPESPQLYPPDQLTDVSDRFMAAEIVREKLTRRLQEEVPYGLVVEIEGMGEAEDEPGKLVIQAVIWVERTGQKAIVIGKGGELLKEVGRAARLELRHHFGKPVHLELWVKVREGWTDDESALRSFGFET
ncbi:MAG: GTPase [Pseudomonadota bacterium]|nr:GTPase [Pseudomonadota bacterium]MDQ1308739.1 GTPase [Pseudomonadota bacterium]MDQ1341848.1 GTPase [Pseudomonadota bacterium]